MSGTGTLRWLFASIATDLDAVDRSFQQRVTSGLDILDALGTYALHAPGKRLRMALTLLSGKLTDYRIEKLLPLSVALEMAHLATLVHDDIIDAAGTRHGQPTLNALYGDRLAILLGDYLFAKTAALAPEVEDHRINRLLAATVATICQGTMHEVFSAGRLDLSIDTYLERIRCKTACLFAACCEGGAIVGGGSESQIAALHEYGLCLGLALQMADDARDYAGSRASLGKPVGSDLGHGLVTLPLIYALAADHDGRAEQVAAVLEEPDKRQDEIRAIVRWVKSGPGVPAALELARQYAAQARAALAAFPASAERAVLDELVDFLVAHST